MIGDVTQLDWLLDVIEEVKPVLNDDSIPRWLNTSVPALDGDTPLEAIIDGRGRQVRDVAESYREAVY